MCEGISLNKVCNGNVDLGAMREWEEWVGYYHEFDGSHHRTPTADDIAKGQRVVSRRECPHRERHREPRMEDMESFNV